LLKILSRLTALAALLILAACAEPVAEGSSDDPDILSMGDSMLAWNSNGGRSVSHVVEQHLGRPVLDRSVIGARMLYALPISGSLGLRISSQYVPGGWDWVILNGGGNDLWLGCGCSGCDRKMARMISSDGLTGEIPALVDQIRATNAKVIYLGYLRTPGRGSPIDHCREIGEDFERRLNRMANEDPGVFFLPNHDIVPHGDLSYHGPDRIHPSAKGSAAIGARVADLIQSSES
jgi:hypothetical protein